MFLSWSLYFSSAAASRSKVAIGGQSDFKIFLLQTQTEDKAVKQVPVFFKANYTNPLSVDDLAKEAGVSRRNPERRFRKATFNSIAGYIQRVRIEAAKQNCPFW